MALLCSPNSPGHSLVAVRVPRLQEGPRLALLPSGVSPFLSEAEPRGPGAGAHAILCLGGTDTSGRPSEKPPTTTCWKDGFRELSPPWLCFDTKWGEARPPGPVLGCEWRRLLSLSTKLGPSCPGRVREWVLCVELPGSPALRAFPACQVRRSVLADVLLGR